MRARLHRTTRGRPLPPRGRRAPAVRSSRRRIAPFRHTSFAGHLGLVRAGVPRGCVCPPATPVEGKEAAPAYAGAAPRCGAACGAVSAAPRCLARPTNSCLGGRYLHLHTSAQGQDRQAEERGRCGPEGWCREGATARGASGDCSYPPSPPSAAPQQPSPATVLSRHASQGGDGFDVTKSGDVRIGMASWWRWMRGRGRGSGCSSRIGSSPRNALRVTHPPLTHTPPPPLHPLSTGRLSISSVRRPRPRP